MHQRHHGEHHALVSLGEVGEKFLGLAPELFQVIGDRGGEVVLVVLALLPACDVRLNAQDAALNLLHGLVRGNRENVNGQHEAPGEVGEIGDHAVLDVAGVVLEEQDPAHLVPHFKMPGPEPQAVRADQIPKVQTPADGGGLIECEILFLAGAEKVVQNAEPVMGGDGPGAAVQASEALGEVGVHPAEVGPAFLNLPLGDGEGDVLLLDQIVALRRPLGENAVGFPAVLVQAVPPLLHQNGALEVYGVKTAVDDGDFGGGVRGQGVEDAAVREENTPPVILGRGGVVDVGKAPGPAVLAAHQPDAVLVDAFDGDRLLDAAGNLELVPLALVGGGKGLNQNLWPPFGSAWYSRNSRRQSAALRRKAARI